MNLNFFDSEQSSLLDSKLFISFFIFDNSSPFKICPKILSKLGIFLFFSLFDESLLLFPMENIFEILERFDSIGLKGKNLFIFFFGIDLTELNILYIWNLFKKELINYFIAYLFFENIF